jgi:hypothetical protein
MAACGMPFIRDSRPESDEVFPFLPAFTSPEHAAYELMKLLDSPERVEYLGNAARRAIEDRTFDNNARLMMRALADDLAA